MVRKNLFLKFLKRIFILNVFVLSLGIEGGNAAQSIFEDSEDCDISYSQTMGYLKAFLGDNFVEITPEAPLEAIKRNVYELYDPDKRYCGSFLKDRLGVRTDINHPNMIPIGEALLGEYNSPDRKYGYHAVSAQIGFLYDLYAELRRQIMGVQREDLFLARGTDQVFSGLQNIADFIHEQLQKQNKKSFCDLNNYGSDYAEKALSINLFLFGNCGTAFDDTIKFFTEGESDRNILLKRSLIKLFTYFGIDMTNTEEVDNLLVEFEALPLARGRLFQFSFASGTIDEFVYLSQSVGVGVTIDGSKEYDINKEQVCTLIHNLQKNPLEVKQLSEEVHHYEDGIPVPYFNLATIQARFLPHPRLCCEDSAVKVRSYWHGLSSNDPDILIYKQSLKELISKIVPRILMSGLALPKATILTCGPFRTLPFSKPCRDVIQEKTDVPQTDNPIISDHLLSAYICSGDLEQFSQVLKFNPQMDINRVIIDINDLEDQTNHSPLYLAVKYNHPEIVDFLLSNDAHIANEEADDRNLMGWACLHGYVGIVQKLLNSGCAPHLTFRVRLHSEPVIMLAQENGFSKIVETLLTQSEFDLSDKLYNQLLPSVIEAQQNDVLKALFLKVNSKMNNLSSGDRLKTLNLTIESGNEELVKSALKLLEPPLESFFETPAIIKAIDQEDLSIIRLLIAAGADLVKKYGFRGTPLERATKKNNQEIISLITNELK